MFIMYFTPPIQRKPKENTELTLYESACRLNLQIIVMWFFGVFQQKTEYQEWAGSFEKTIVMLAREDIEWLDELVVHLKRARRKTSKSEVIRLSLKKIRGMSESEILNDLRFLE